MADEQTFTTCCWGCDPSCDGPSTCADRAWAEVKRLRAGIDKLAEENYKRYWNIQRLRAAGDALAEALHGWCNGMDAFTDDWERLRVWQEARRG